MKSLLLFICFVIFKSSFAQDSTFSELSAFNNEFMLYNSMDSIELKEKAFYLDKKYPNLAVRNENSKINVAYHFNGLNKWRAIELSDKIYAIDYKIINLDDKDLPEVFLFWQEFEYSSNGGTSTDWISIIRLDSLPIQIFKICVGCNEESFGDKEKNGEGAFYNTYLRSYKITQNAVILSNTERKKYPYQACPISPIPGGTYKMIEKQILKVR